jgi:hypothetical protein
MSPTDKSEPFNQIFQFQAAGLKGQGGGVNNHNLHSTLAQSCKEDFMTKTNSKREVSVRNLILLTGVSKLPPCVNCYFGVSLQNRAVQLWGSRSLIHNFSLGVKWMYREPGQSSPSRAEVMNAWS